MEDKTKSKTAIFMEALSKLEDAVSCQVCEGDSWLNLGNARAEVVSAFQDNIIVQSDDALLECYRIAIQNKASEAQLDSILEMIAKEKGIRM